MRDLSVGGSATGVEALIVLLAIPDKLEMWKATIHRDGENPLALSSWEGVPVTGEEGGASAWARRMHGQLWHGQPLNALMDGVSYRHLQALDDLIEESPEWPQTLLLMERGATIDARTDFATPDTIEAEIRLYETELRPILVAQSDLSSFALCRMTVMYERPCYMLAAGDASATELRFIRIDEEEPYTLDISEPGMVITGVEETFPPLALWVRDMRRILFAQ